MSWALEELWEMFKRWAQQSRGRSLNPVWGKLSGSGFKAEGSDDMELLFPHICHAPGCPFWPWGVRAQSPLLASLFCGSLF